MEENYANNNENATKKGKNCGFLLYRCCVALVIVIALTLIKFALPEVFVTVQKFYKENFAVNINADYFLENSDDKISDF